MTNPKRTILLVLLFMVIGIAAVTTNVVISGSTNIAKNPDDFLVYFSDVKVNGVQDLSLVKNEKQLVFNKEFSSVGQRVEITYDITNASKNYDASISISCTPSTEYLSIVNDYDTANNLGARQSKTGVLTITQSKSYTGDDLTQEISCTINATAVERTSQGSVSVPSQLSPFYVGREISIGTEKFNVISSDADTVTMLAQKNISDSTSYKQIDEQMYTIFSDSDGWEYIPGPKEIDIWEWSSYTSEIVDNYVSYLKTEYDIDVTGDLITMAQLGELGCTIPSDYAWISDANSRTCNNSDHSEWLVNGQYWWTRSAYSGTSSHIWMMIGSGNLSNDRYNNGDGVRPTITISKEVALQLINVYPIGEEITIGTEKFNVISDNGLTVSMLAQKNISMSDPYKQTEEYKAVKFSVGSGWEYQPGPKEIDVQSWGEGTKIVLNNYVSYLKTEYDIDVTSDLITLKELEKLGCTIPSNYAWGNAGRNDYTCVNSEYIEWLANEQSSWTRSALSEEFRHIWILNGGGNLSYDFSTNSSGVRPVITISKSLLN